MAALVAALVVPSCKKADAPPPPAETEAAEAAAAPVVEARRSTPALGFLAHFDASHETIAYVGDLAPWVSRFTRSELYRRVATDSWVVARFPGAPTTAAVGEVWLAKNKQWFPLAVAVGVDEHAGPALARIMRLSFLLQSSMTANASPVGLPLLPEIRKLVRDDVAAFAVPSVVVWLQMDSAATAEQLLTLVRPLLGQLPPTIAVTDTPDAISIVTKVEDYIDQEALAQSLENTGLVGSATDKSAIAMSSTILALGAQAKLTRHDDALVLSIGPATPRDKGLPRTRESLGTLFTPESSEMVAWAGWDITATAELVDATAKTIEQWRTTEAGREILAGDTEDSAGDITDFQRQLASSPPRGEGRIEVGDELRVTMVRDASASSPTIASTRLLDVVPGNAAGIRLDATLSFGEAMADAVADGETRLYNSLVKSWVRNDGSAEKQQKVVDAYYRSFAALRVLLLRDATKVFVAPYATIVSTSHSTELRVGQGTTQLVLPLPAVAFFTTPAQGADVVAWLESVNREAARAAFNAAGKVTPSDVRSRVMTKDIGLGVPTHVIELDWTDEILPGGVTIDASEDSVFHAFEHEGFVVLSTSVALSTAIRAGTGHVRATPQADAIAYTHVSGAGIADSLTAIGEAMAADAETRDALLLSARIAGILDEYVVNEHVHGEKQRRSVQRVTLRE